jgi:predicted RNase H-like HicB family nuclease
MANYIAVVYKDPKSDFGVSFPDFPGCITTGSSIDEAKDMAHDALSLHINGMLKDGDNIPAPSKLEDIMDDPDYSDAAAILVVSVSEVKTRSVRVNITVPEDMLRKIDSVAKKRGMSRSSFLVHAAQNAITSGQNSQSL